MIGVREIEKVPLGTDKKLLISIDPIGYITMDDYDFEVEVYTRSKTITIYKDDAVRKDSNTYAIGIDTALLGKGRLFVKVKAYIPDSDFSDHLRTEISIIDTKIDII